jgi:NADH-quinone oxidoreductase subunit E
MALREKYGQEIDAILARYAEKRSAVLPVLYIAQDEYGYLTEEAIREVAEILELPYTDVFEVVGFYTLLYNQPVGTWVLQVCDDVPCCFLGAEELVAELERKLNIRVNQTTSDGMFTLQRVKCLADCDHAPVLQANLEYYRNLTPDQLDGLLEELRRRAASGERLSISGRFAER